MRRRGWILYEVIFAMFLIAGLATLGAVVMNRQSTAMQHLADDRAATQLAESVLMSLQGNQPLPKDEGKWTLRAMSDPSPVTHMKWVEVDARVGRGSSSLTGLVPEGTR